MLCRTHSDCGPLNAATMGTLRGLGNVLRETSTWPRVVVGTGFAEDRGKESSSGPAKVRDGMSGELPGRVRLSRSTSRPKPDSEGS